MPASSLRARTGSAVREAVGPRANEVVGGARLAGTRWRTRRPFPVAADRPDQPDRSVRPYASGRPLLAPAVRPWAAALLACCAILVAVLGALFAHQTRADGFDRAVDTPIITSFAGHQSLALWLAKPGSLIPAAVLTAAIVIACVVAGRINGSVLALAAVA